MENFLSQSGILWPAIISAIVSLSIQFIFRWLEKSKDAELSYRFDQKAKIKTAIGSHLGRTLVDAERLENRLVNLSGNFNKDWLHTGDPASKSGHYMKSTVIRFLTFFETIYRVEDASISLDARHADDRDYEFLNYIYAFQWTMRDIESLFYGVPHERNSERDHLYADSLRELCSRFSKIPDRDAENSEMIVFLDDPKNAKIFSFFERMSPLDGRPRWDRIYSLHFLLAGFQDSFGHKRHNYSAIELERVLENIRRPAVLKNLYRGLIMFDLHRSKSGCKLAESLQKSLNSKTGSFV